MLSNTVTLVDIVSREEFGAWHIVGAVNIPDDELYSRALNELMPAQRIVLFTRNPDLRKVINARR